MSSPSTPPESTGRPVEDSPTPRRRRWPAMLVGALVVVFAVGWQLAGPVRASAPAHTTTPVRARTVEVAPLTRAPLVRAHRVFGVTRAAQRAELALTLSGRLTERAVHVGDRVTAGQRLARIDPKPLRHAVAGARAAVREIDAALAQAQRDRDLAAALAARKAAPAEEAEQRRAAVERLVANRAAARVRLAEARRQHQEGGLVAPFDGVITAVHFEVGELVPAGRPVVGLAGDGGVEVEVEVPESIIHRLAIGQAVEVELPLRGGAITGAIERLGRQAQGVGRLFPVVVRLPADAGPVSSGMTAIARLQTQGAPTLLAPLGAILDPAGGAPRLFRVRPRPEGPDARPSLAGLMVEQIPVRFGGLNGDGLIAIEPAAGALDAGDAVVIGGHFALLDGDPVRLADVAAR